MGQGGRRTLCKSGEGVVRNGKKLEVLRVIQAPWVFHNLPCWLWVSGGRGVLSIISVTKGHLKAHALGFPQK